MSGHVSGYRPVHLGRVSVDCRARPDGTFEMRARERLPDWPRTLMDVLARRAREIPDRTFLADRGPDGAWRHLGYAAAHADARAIGEALLKRGLGPRRPVMILSGNSIEHGQMALACQMAGVPYAPVSPAYSLRSNDFAKLRHVIGLVTPGLVFVDEATPFARAIAAAVPDDVEIVTVRGEAGRPATPYRDLVATEPGPGIEAAFRALTGDTIAKFLFTSGSTGMPKAVINTHRMLSCNQVMIANALAFLRDEPPVLLDWLPWNHTAGSNHNFGIALYNGGTLYIDDGVPAPGQFDRTVRNLMEVSPTVYFNVPKGYEMLADHLGSDPALCEKFYARLHAIQYAGAGLAQHVWEALEDLAVETVGEKVLIMTGYGSTETAPFAFTTTGPVPGAGFVGVPAPGLDVKLVPAEGKLGLRVRGPSITPGYWRMPDKTAQSFDEEGFYVIGDALRFADPDNADAGFIFDGRVSEDFKLSTGTWVNMGAVRAAVIAAFAPYVRDVVLTGLDRSHIGAMVFLDLEATRRLAPDLETAGERDLARDPRVRREFAMRLDRLAARATGSSNLVKRLLILDEPPSLDRGEVTDKGSINQRAVIGQRAREAEKLYAEPVPDEVLVAGSSNPPPARAAPTDPTRERAPRSR